MLHDVVNFNIMVVICLTLWYGFTNYYCVAAMCFPLKDITL